MALALARERPERVAVLLGGRKVLRSRIRATREMQLALRKGLPFAAFEALGDALQVSSDDLAQLIGLATRTLARRKALGRLSPAESDRLYRVAHTTLIAAESLGSLERARQWLGRPNRALGGDRPISYLDTEIGERQVEELLQRLGHGIYS